MHLYLHDVVFANLSENIEPMCQNRNMAQFISDVILPPTRIMLHNIHRKGGISFHPIVVLINEALKNPIIMELL